MADGTFFHALHDELVQKKETFGIPTGRMLLGVLLKLTPEVRHNYGWEATEISLRNPDHGVREIERTFRKLGWDFDQAKVCSTAPPDFDLFVLMLKDLARYFDERPVNVAAARAAAASSGGSTADTASSSSSSSDASSGASGGDGRPKKKDLAYWVKGSKSGGLNVTKQRGKRGKWVTILPNVGGDVVLMLKELRQALGAGGTYNEATQSLEMQGDCIAAVEKWLVRQQCLVGVTAKLKTNIAKDELAKKAREDALKAKINAVRQADLARQRRANEVDVGKPLTAKEMSGMKPDDLKRHLKARGLSTQGSKKELHARLAEHVKQLESGGGGGGGGSGGGGGDGGGDEPSLERVDEEEREHGEQEEQQENEEDADENEGLGEDEDEQQEGEAASGGGAAATEGASESP
jgi:translation initiation factor 1 (eIF-1/SUI1)